MLWSASRLQRTSNTSFTHSRALLPQRSVISLLFVLTHPFASKERSSTTDLLSTLLDGACATRTPPLSASPSLFPFSFFSYHHRFPISVSHPSPPHLSSFACPPHLFTSPAWVAEFNEFSFLSAARRWFLIVKRFVCVSVWGAARKAHTHFLSRSLDCDHFRSLNKSQAFVLIKESGSLFLPSSFFKEKVAGCQL